MMCPSFTQDDVMYPPLPSPPRCSEASQTTECCCCAQAIEQEVMVQKVDPHYPPPPEDAHRAEEAPHPYNPSYITGVYKSPCW